MKSPPIAIRPVTLMAMGQVETLPPVGVYLGREVGRLAGVSGDRIGQWARRGYIRASQGHGPPNLYSYQDVAEAMVVHDMLDHGLPLRSIRVAVETLRDDFGNWPLTQADLYVQPDSGLVAVREEAVYFEASRPRMRFQGLYDLGDLHRVAQDLRRGGWAARVHEELQYIEVHPERLSGHPTIRGRRIEADLVAEIAQEPRGRRRLRREYDLTNPEIDDASKWWQVVRAYEAA